MESSVFPWQRITARKNKIYLGIKQNTLNDDPIFSHWNFITHDIFFFLLLSISQIYLCSFFTLFSIFTGYFHTHEFGRAPWASAWSKPPLSSPTTSASGSAEHSVLQVRDKKRWIWNPHSFYSFFLSNCYLPIQLSNNGLQYIIKLEEILAKKKKCIGWYLFMLHSEKSKPRTH